MTKLVADGGSKGNPGPMYAKVYDLDNERMLQVKGPDTLKEGTNNQAEFIAIGMAAALAKEDDIIYSDSQTARAWACGRGNPTVPVKWIAKLVGLMYKKRLTIRIWPKDKPNPADCK